MKMGRDDIAIVGSSPKVIDIKRGKQFVSPGGRLLRKKLQSLGIKHATCTYFNAVQCHVGQVYSPVVHQCADRFIENWTKIPWVTHVLFMGARSFETVLPHARPASRNKMVYLHGKWCMCVDTIESLLMTKDPDAEANWQRALNLFAGHHSGLLLEDPPQCAYCNKVVDDANNPACRTHVDMWRKDRSWRRSPAHQETLF